MQTPQGDNFVFLPAFDFDILDRWIILGLHQGVICRLFGNTGAGVRFIGMLKACH